MGLLGDDGLGYELARNMESHGVWRSWLGDAFYSTFIHFLSSPAAWDAFMRPSADDSNTNKPPQIHLHLQLRVRALLFDKAAVSLYTRSPLVSSNISDLNPNYLELHGDDVYFTLENGGQDEDQRRPGLATSNTTSSKGQSKTSSNTGELPETWYTQFFEKYRASKSYRLMFSDRESEKRTPEQMSTYLRVLENHKRKRVAFKENLLNQRPNSLAGDSDVVDDKLFFPETMFTLNCVPDCAVLQTNELENNQKMQLNGVLDNLPQIMTKSPVISPIMIERLGIRPEYLNMEQQQQQGHQTRGFEGKRKLLGQEQAAQISQKVIARMLTNVGFESSSVAATEILAQFLTCHVNKLGGRLKLLSDSYRKQCSAIELLKMFLQTSGYRNLGPLAELVKDNTRNIIVQPTPQVQGIHQAQLQQPTLQQSQQDLVRQMSPQMMQQQMNNPQYLAFQQQQQHLERMRRRQQQQQSITPRPAAMNANIMNMDKDRPLVQVKMENPLVQVKMENPEMPLDANNSFTAMNSRHPHLQQLRQQQLAAISSMHAQANNNPFKQINSLQLQQIQSMNMGMTRAQPVKVEGFQELMGGGDSSMKHESDENKLLSPPK